MENKERQILSEIMELMASVRSQLEILDAKMAELQQTVGQEAEDLLPIDLEIDDDVTSDDLPSEQETVDEQVEACEDVEEDVEEDDGDLPIFADPEPDPEQDPEPDQDSEPLLVSCHEPVQTPAQQRVAVIDSMTDRQAWRTDMPGTQVKDIRSAISLNDRILFINMLFGQDPMSFQDALTKINQMQAIDEVVGYIAEEHPEWNLESETVYRFMMAVRRKIR